MDGLNPEFDQTRSQILGKSPLPKLEEAFAFVQYESSRREAMLHKTHAEVAAKTEASANKGNNNQKKPWNKSNYYCDYCERPGHSRERCYKLRGHDNDPKKTGGNNSTKKEQSGPKANTTETVTPQNVSLEDLQAELQAVKRFLAINSALSSTSESAGFLSTVATPGSSLNTLMPIYYMNLTHG